MRQAITSFAVLTSLCLATPALAVCVIGTPNNPENDCDLDGCTVSQGDCADNPPVNPLASTIRGPGCPGGAFAETCDGEDNNCSGASDEGNPGGGLACVTGQQGVCSPGTTACTSGAVVCNRNVNPSAEACNAADDNCNGSTDEGNPGGGGACATGEQGVCSAGTRQCQAGSLNCVRTTGPSSETCNTADDNCNGMTDEGFNVGQACTSTNVGVCAPGTIQCQGGGTAACVSTIAPGSRTETCNAQDDDCDGLTDENNPGGGGACSTGQQGICSAGTRQCQSGSLTCVRTNNPIAELCNGLDDDCNGTNDNGFNIGMACTVGGQQGRCAMGTMQCQGTMASACVGPGPIAETCNNVDDNCNGSTDEGNPGGGVACSTGLQGVCAAGTRQCQSGNLNCIQNVMSTPEVCDTQDNNCNGTVDEGLITDADGDGSRACGTCGAAAAPNCDCNDMNNMVKPGQAEICNSVDEDCDGLTDENLSRVCYTGPAGTFTGTCPGPSCAPRGVCRGVTQACTAGAFPACTAGLPGEVLPGMEICNNLNDDCDTQTDEGLSGAACTTGQLGVCNPGTEQCTAGSLTCVRNVNPSAEVCDNEDDNCNGVVDDGVPPRVCFTGPPGTYGGTCPGATCLPRGQCRSGTQLCNGAGAFGTCTGQTLPAMETCNTLDDNCDGNADDGLITDVDMDSSRACGTCGAPAAGSCDCNDMNNQVRPGRAETCNAIDDDCDAQTDEGSGPGGKLSQNCYSGPAGTAGVGVCVQGTQGCTATVVGMASWGACVNQVVPSAETCNGSDDNCDGATDDGFDQDGDGFFACASCPSTANCDCNDTDAAVKPGAVEVCDAVDQNCNGQLDDVMPRRCFAGPLVTPDTYTGTCPGPMCSPKGACMPGTQTCSAQGAWGSCAGQVLPANDPAGDEALCDMRDEDCDGTVDDGTFDQDMDGVKSCEGDCNDADPTVKPGALEICDNKDNDCNGTVDGNNTGCYSGPANTRGLGQCRDGTQTCVNGVGMGVCAGERTPALLADGGVPQHIDGGSGDPELVCDGLDEDCDDVVDDGYDLDGDGVTSCAGDCDDTDAFNKPGAVEQCDCTDNNCNAQIDEGNVCRGAPCHDFDFDGITNCQGDCDDSNAAINPLRTEVVGNLKDDDCDGALDEDTDEDGDGFTTGQGDCDDHFASINPGAVEVCDGFDNTCNNQVDEGFDQDGDFATVCAGDCDDMDNTRSPFRREVCGNSLDDNCDGRVDEDTDADGDGVTTCQNDCNDYNADMHPAAGSVPEGTEVCDGQDNDCDGVADEGFDVDGDFVATCFGDCDDSDTTVNPNQYEIAANLKDDDCDGRVDEGTDDVDMDGFPPVCGDCNDADPSINPHATEVCDRVDNNCDSYVDSAPGKYDLCAVCFDADNDGQTNCDGDCNDADATIYRGAPELCDLKDNDCDGDTDLDPATGLRVCVSEDGGVLPDGGPGGGGEDSGTGGGGGGGGDGTGGGGERPRVAVGCNCTSTGDLAPWFALALLGLGFRARRRASLKALARTAAPWVVLLAMGAALGLPSCSSSLTTPPTNGGGDGGEPGDGGTDGGFIVPVADWPCPGLQPKETLEVALPGTFNHLAYTRNYQVQVHEGAQFVLLDDAAADVAGFVIRRPVPMDLDPSDPQALLTVATRELEALTSLGGSPLVRDRTERFSRVFSDGQMAADGGTELVLAGRNFAHAEQLTFASPSTAFAVRNRLLTSLSGRTAQDLGTLPVVTGAHAQDSQMVYVFFRLTQTDFFVGAAVSPTDRFRDNQPALSDLGNGSHLSARNGRLTYDCETRSAPALKTDFIFVVDNSASMLEEQAALVNASDRLFAAFEASGLDFRIGVITTDSDVLRGGGFTNQLDAFKSDVRVGIDGNGLEMGVEFALRAIRRAKTPTLPESFRLREEAGLVVVFVTDEENTGLQPIAAYAQEYVAEKAVAFGIVGPRPVGCTRVGLGRAVAGAEYIDLAARTGGSTGSICNPNITEVVEEILFGAIGVSSKSPLAKRPISGSLAVETDHLIPRTRVNGFDYDPGTNTVLFFGSVPAEGTSFRAAYALFNYIQ